MRDAARRTAPKTKHNPVPVPKRKRGAPKGSGSKYTPALAQKICDRLSQGEPMTIICDDDHMPSTRAVYNWGLERPDFAANIARARIVGYDRIAVRAKNTLRGLGVDAGGESTGDIQRDKAIADFDLKLLAKWDPKRYGEKLAVVGGSETDTPIQSKITVEFVRPKGGA